MVVIVLLALFIAIPAEAQHHIGFTGGLNLAKISVEPEDPDTDIANLVAFGVGGVLDLRLAENVALHLQPLYLQKGAKDGSAGSDAKIKLAYLEVPALVKIAFGTSTAKPYIMAGPSLGFLLSAKSTDEGESADIKEFFKDIDFGLAFGAGVSFPAGNNAIFVEGRYGLGLSNIAKLEEGEEGSIKTRGIQFMAGVTFPLGGK
jgi:opacity protein-like surface antigen